MTTVHSQGSQVYNSQNYRRSLLRRCSSWPATELEPNRSQPERAQAAPVVLVAYRPDFLRPVDLFDLAR